MKGKIVTISGYAPLVKLDDIFKHNNMSNADHVVQDLQDILQSYFKVARKRVVDNLCMQAADFYLLTGPDTPLNVLSPEFIRRLTAEELEEVAGEDADVKHTRAELRKAIQDLETGQMILSKR